MLIKGQIGEDYPQTFRMFSDMASTNRTVRASVVDIAIKGQSEQTLVFNTKDAMVSYLFGLATRQWATQFPNKKIPSSRKAVLEQFFTGGNEYSVSSCTMIPNQVAEAHGETARKALTRNTKVNSH